MTDLSDEALEQLMAYARAVPMPWTSSWEGRDHWSGDSIIVTGSKATGWGPDVYVSVLPSEGPSRWDQQYQDVVAAAVTNLPALVQEIQELREEITRVRSER